MLGCGYAGREIALRARAAKRTVRVTVRSHEHAAALGAEGLEVLRSDTLDASIAAHIGPSTHVVVAFPPDGAAENVAAEAARGARALTFLSTTGVYAESAGRVDGATEVPAPTTDRLRRLLGAEATLREAGAAVLRCPGIYGPDRGLHVRVVSGKHRIPGDGSRSLSRIHVEDLASFALACGEVASARGKAFVIGDLTPAPHLEVVQWICDHYGVPLPPFAPLEDVHVSLRADRRVDPSEALAALGVTLRYPDFRDGMGALPR